MRAGGARPARIVDGAVTRTETISGVNYSITRTVDHAAAESTGDLRSRDS